MKIKKGDQVKILAGRDRDRKGKVIKVFPAKLALLVEGLNLHKKHARPKQAGKKGEIVLVPGLIPMAKVQLVCPHCSKSTRVGFEMKGGVKTRICKKCRQTI